MTSRPASTSLASATASISRRGTSWARPPRDQFTEPFRAEYEQQLNGEFTKPETYDKRALRDPQGRHGPGPIPLRRNGHGSAVTGRYRARLPPVLRRRRGRQEGRLPRDAPGASWAPSACPWRRLPTARSRGTSATRKGGESHLHHGVDRLPDGGYRITTDFLSRPNFVVLPEGDAPELDSTRSHYNVQITFEISRRVHRQRQPPGESRRHPVRLLVPEVNVVARISNRGASWLTRIKIRATGLTAGHGRCRCLSSGLRSPRASSS